MNMIDLLQRMLSDAEQRYGKESTLANLLREDIKATEKMIANPALEDKEEEEYWAGLRAYQEQNSASAQSQTSPSHIDT